MIKRYHRFVVFLATVGVSALAIAQGAAPPPAPLRDPTQPPGIRSTLAPEDAFVVTSLLLAPTRRLALVNGRWVRPGDTIDGAAVIEIERNLVKIRLQSGKLLRLPLISDGVRRPPPPVRGEGQGRTRDDEP